MQNQGGRILLIKHTHKGKLTLLLICVYVDHMTIVGDDEVEKQILREKLAPQFDLKKLKYISVIEVVYP